MLLSSALCAATLDDIKYTSLPGDRVQIKLTLSEPVSGDPLSFTIDNPARVAFDFPGTTLKALARSQHIGVGKVESVNAVEAEGRTRVVVNLVQLTPYQVETAGNVVTVTLEGVPADITAVPGAMAAAPAAGREATPATATMPGTASGERIEGIDFRRGPAGEAQIVVDLSNPNIGINIEEQGGKLIVDFIDTQLPEELDRKLDVTDFATPAREVDTTRHGNGTRMVVTPTGLFEHLAYQSDDVFTLELRPLTKQEEEQLKKDRFGYTGERLSLNFQDIEVRAVLQLIADFTGFNLVASDTVGGNVTLRLKNVPWDQAMDLILKTKGLGMRQVGNVIMVAPQEEIAAREKLELEAQQQIQELAPLKTEFVQVNYAKASDIAGLLKEEANNMLTDRGNVTVDQRTNTLLIQDTAEALTDIRQVVTALDIPVRQVLIESRIVVANEDFSRDIGVRFGYSHINNPKNAWLFDARFHVDVALNQADILASLIEQEMSLGDMMTLLKLRRGRFSVVSEKIAPDARAARRSIQELPLPKNCVIAAIVRAGEIVIPRGAVRFEPGDEVLAVVDAEAAEELAALLEPPAEPAEAKAPR